MFARAFMRPGGGGRRAWVKNPRVVRARETGWQPFCVSKGHVEPVEKHLEQALRPEFGLVGRAVPARAVAGLGGSKCDAHLEPESYRERGRI